ncbi:MAG: hypothetical protein AABY22_18420 [Nanoarchaeota archaeon]
MKKKRFRICGWCGQVIESETKKQEKLLEHLERCHNDYQHKRK